MDGFFRRTILRNQRFSCRFNKQCVIDKNFRCACRYCRFQKCLSAGMKREAIQFERDTTGSNAKKRLSSDNSSLHRDVWSRGGDDGGGTGGYSNFEEDGVPSNAYRVVIDTLMEMEARVNHEMTLRYRSTIISNVPLGAENQADAYSSGAATMPTKESLFSQAPRPCTVDELNEISRTTLLLMVEWAKNLAPFPDLAMEDKIILLKNYAPQHLILMPAFRSPDTTRVCLFNNTYMSRNADQSGEMNGFAAFKTSSITPRVLDEIVWPMRQLQMREQEFVCLKALAFLHPEAKGLSSGAQILVREARNRILKALYSIIFTHNADEAPTRYGNILLLAPALKALTQLLIENMTLTKFFGLAEVDSLLSEFILDDLNDPQATAPVSIKQHLSSAQVDTSLVDTSLVTTSADDCASTSLDGRSLALGSNTINVSSVNSSIPSTRLNAPNANILLVNQHLPKNPTPIDFTNLGNTKNLNSIELIHSPSSSSANLLNMRSENASNVSADQNTLNSKLNNGYAGTPSLVLSNSSSFIKNEKTVENSINGDSTSMENFIATMLLSSGAINRNFSVGNSTTSLIQSQPNSSQHFSNQIKTFHGNCIDPLVSASASLIANSADSPKLLPTASSTTTTNSTSNNNESMLTAL